MEKKLLQVQQHKSFIKKKLILKFRTGFLSILELLLVKPNQGCLSRGPQVTRDRDVVLCGPLNCFKHLLNQEQWQPFTTV